MDKPNKEEVHAAIADLIRGSSGKNEPYNVLAKRLHISTSSLRRIAKQFGISRRKSVEETVLDALGPNWAHELRDDEQHNESGDKS